MERQVVVLTHGGADPLPPTAPRDNSPRNVLHGIATCSNSPKSSVWYSEMRSNWSSGLMLDQYLHANHAWTRANNAYTSAGVADKPTNQPTYGRADEVHCCHDMHAVLKNPFSWPMHSCKIESNPIKSHPIASN